MKYFIKKKGWFTYCTLNQHIKQCSTQKILKHKWVSAEFDTEEISAEQKAAVWDMHGCIKLDMKFVPVK